MQRVAMMWRSSCCWCPRKCIINRADASCLTLNVYCYSIAPTLGAQGGSRLSPAYKHTGKRRPTKYETKWKTKQIDKGTLLVHVSGIRYQVLNAEKDPSMKKVERRNAWNFSTVGGWRKYFGVQTGNRRKEGTRENEKQSGGWRRSFSEHKKNATPPKSYEWTTKKEENRQKNNTAI